MRERKREKGCVRARAEYSQTCEFQKALDYADVSQRVSDAGPFDDVCKYRSSMINCSCQDTRYFARAYRNPVSTGETDSAYNFRSSTVGEFSSFLFPSLTPSSRWTLSRFPMRNFREFRHDSPLSPLSPLPSPHTRYRRRRILMETSRHVRSILRAMIETSPKTFSFISILMEKIWKEIFSLSLLNFFYS